MGYWFNHGCDSVHQLVLLPNSWPAQRKKRAPGEGGRPLQRGLKLSGEVSGEALSGEGSPLSSSSEALWERRELSGELQPSLRFASLSIRRGLPLSGEGGNFLSGEVLFFVHAISKRTCKSVVLLLRGCATAVVRRNFLSLRGVFYHCDGVWLWECSHRVCV